MTEPLHDPYVDVPAQLGQGGRAAWLVVGKVDLRNGTALLQGSDLVILIPVPCVETYVPSNTIVLRWSELGPVKLIASTVDGSRRRVAQDHGAGLFTLMSPGNTLRRLIAQVIGAQIYDTAALPVPYVPLFYVSAHGLDLYVYSKIKYLAEDACFIRITQTPLRVRRIEDLAWLATAVELHAEQAPFLNNHQCDYRKCFDGKELEYKYTLTPNADIWGLTIDAYHRLLTGNLSGFIRSTGMSCRHGTTSATCSRSPRGSGNAAMSPSYR